MKVRKWEGYSRKHATDVWHHLGSAVLVLKVEWGSPVGRHVLGDAAGRAVVLLIRALCEVLVVGSLAKV